MIRDIFRFNHYLKKKKEELCSYQVSQSQMQIEHD